MRVWIKPSGEDWATYVLAGITEWFIRAFAIMFFLGIAHQHVHASIPPLGYWQAFVVVILLGLVGGAFRDQTPLWEIKKGFEKADERNSIGINITNRVRERL